MIDVGTDLNAFCPKLCGYCGQTFCYKYQKILHGGQIWFLSTDSDSGTSGASCGFLTLIAKHSLIHK